MNIIIRKPAAEESEKILQLAKSCRKIYSSEEFFRDLENEGKSLVVAETENDKANEDHVIVGFGLAEEVRGKEFTFETPKYDLIQTRFFAKKEYAQEAERQFVGYWLAEAKKRKINRFFVELIDEEEEV